MKCRLPSHLHILPLLAPKEDLLIHRFKQPARLLVIASLMLVVIVTTADRVTGQELTIPDADDLPIASPEQSSQPSIRVFQAPPTVDGSVEPFDRSFENGGRKAGPLDIQVPTAGRQVYEDFSITLATSLLARFVNDQRVNSKPVATQVMEASVSGNQTTTTDVGLQSVDSPTRAELQILTEGTVSSTTIGVTPQATVNTVGSHTFQVTKPVYFDGRQFLTKQAYGSLQARQFPQSVNTNVARTFPLLGRIGNQIAWNEVQRRMPQSDAIVVRKVADDVLPTVNESVDRELVKLNRRWSEFHRRLSGLSQLPTLDWSTASTSQSMTVSVSNPEIDSRMIRFSQLTDQLRKEEVCCVLLDELALNHWLDRLKLEGLQVSDADMQQFVRQLPALVKQPAQLMELLRNHSQARKPALLFSVKLASVRPVRIQFREGKFVYTVRFQLLPSLGEPSIVQEVSVSLQGEPAEGDRWTIALRDIKVKPAGSGVQPDAWTSVIRAQLEALLQNQQLPELSRILKASTVDERFPDLKLDRIQMMDGFLRIAFTLANPSLSL